MIPIIDIHHVTYAYDHARPALENVHFAVEPGEFFGIVGPNGGGKSTLLKLILGLIKPQQGHITVLGQSPAVIRKWIGYVPQFIAFNRYFPITVEQVVLMGRLNQASTIGPYTQADKVACRHVLQETDIFHLRHQTIDALSGGELQRVFLARALVANPKILLLDEPTASIDIPHEENIFELLREINQKQVTILLVSHDVGFISKYIKRVACLNHQLMCHQTEKLTVDAMQTLYQTPIHRIDHSHIERQS